MEVRFLITFLGIGGGRALHVKQFLSMQVCFLKPLCRDCNMLLLLTLVSTKASLSFLLLPPCKEDVEDAKAPSPVADPEGVMGRSY